LSAEKWTEVDHYIEDALLPADPALTGALEASTRAGLPAINVSPAQGKMLMLLARIHGASRVLEVGTLGGYSTIWLARALPAGGRLVTLEIDAKHAEVARSNVAAAGLGDRVDVRVGPALETLPKIAAEGLAPFDFTFIDADKPNNPGYFEWAIKLSRPGSVIVVDNVIREGAVTEPASRDPRVNGTRRLFEMLSADKRVSATAIQTVGNKGYDGFVLAVVLGGAG
jgi:predicted O-methyltransferase YrrM